MRRGRSFPGEGPVHAKTGSCENMQCILGKVRNSAWLENRLCGQLMLEGYMGSYLKEPLAIGFFLLFVL